MLCSILLKKKLLTFGWKSFFCGQRCPIEHTKHTKTSTAKVLLFFLQHSWKLHFLPYVYFLDKNGLLLSHNLIFHCKAFLNQTLKSVIAIEVQNTDLQQWIHSKNPQTFKVVLRNFFNPIFFYKDVVINQGNLMFFLKVATGHSWGYESGPWFRLGNIFTTNKNLYICEKKG